MKSKRRRSKRSPAKRKSRSKRSRTKQRSSTRERKYGAANRDVSDLITNSQKVYSMIKNKNISEIDDLVTEYALIIKLKSWNYTVTIGLPTIFHRAIRDSRAKNPGPDFDTPLLWHEEHKFAREHVANVLALCKETDESFNVEEVLRDMRKYLINQVKAQLDRENKYRHEWVNTNVNWNEKLVLINLQPIGMGVPIQIGNAFMQSISFDYKKFLQNNKRVVALMTRALEQSQQPQLSQPSQPSQQPKPVASEEIPFEVERKPFEVEGIMFELGRVGDPDGLGLEYYFVATAKENRKAFYKLKKRYGYTMAKDIERKGKIEVEIVKETFDKILLQIPPPT
jgi:hypothetical protein